MRGKECVKSSAVTPRKEKDVGRHASPWAKDSVQDGDGRGKGQGAGKNSKAQQACQVVAGLHAAAPQLHTDWDVAHDEAESMAWSRMQKYSWYGAPSSEWLSKETVCALCADLGVTTKRKVPCTRVVVTISKQQLLGTLERLVEEQPYSWVTNEGVRDETLRSICRDICVNHGGSARSMRSRLHTIFEDPAFYVQRMCTSCEDDASSDASSSDVDRGECAPTGGGEGKVRF